MAYDFPNAPLPDQIFTPVVGGPSWKWNGTSWEALHTDAPGEAPNDGFTYGRQNETWVQVIPESSHASVLDRANHTGAQAIATVTGLQAALDTLTTDKAPLAGPVFTGDARAVTPAVGDNDTSIATTFFVNKAIADAVAAGGSFPEAPTDGQAYARKSAGWAVAYDKAADDALLAAKAPLASPTFTGDPKAPTPAVSDNDTSVATTAFVQAVAALLSRPTAQARNRIVNPAFQISQQFGNTGGSTNGYFFADQWRGLISSSGTGTFSMLTNSSVAGQAAKNVGRLTVGVADTALTTTENVRFAQTLEGATLADLGWGTAAAKQAVLRFDFLSASAAGAGTYAVYLTSSTGDLSYVATFAATTAWQTFTFVIPGPTTGTFNTDFSAGLSIGVTLACGPSYIAPSLNQWNAGTLLGASGQANGMATVGNDFRIANVGFYADPGNTGLAPAFVEPDPTLEIQRCQRYWQQAYGGAWSQGITTGIGLYGITSALTPMNGGGTVSCTNSTNSNFPATPGTLTLLSNGVRELRVANATATGGGYLGTYTFDARP